MTYLGLDAAHHLSNASVHHSTEACIRACTTALRHRQASPSCKHAIDPKLLYQTANAYWNLNAYRQLDDTLATLLKLTSRYLRSTANEMLYFPTTHGGTDSTNLAILRKLQKNGTNYSVR